MEPMIFIAAGLLGFVLFVAPLAFKRKPKPFDAKEFVDELSAKERDELLRLSGLIGSDTELPSTDEARRRWRATQVNELETGRFKPTNELRVGFVPIEGQWLYYIVLLNNGVPASEVERRLKATFEEGGVTLNRIRIEEFILRPAFRDQSLPKAELTHLIELLRPVIIECLKVSVWLNENFPGRWLGDDYLVAVCSRDGDVLWALDPNSDPKRLNAMRQ